jgi:predicted regulator of Ras-like GTPase activity (Roadblock/LC7/MglB family)
VPVKGDLRDLRLDDLIQVHCQSGATCRISVFSDRWELKLFIDGGEIIHAWSRDAVGVEVVYRMIRLGGNGTFEVVQGESTSQRTIHAPWQNIVMEGMRLLDQQGPWRSINSEPMELLSEGLERMYVDSSFEGLLLVSRQGKVLAAHLPAGQDANRLGAVVSGILNLSTRSLTQLEQGDHMQTVIGGADGQAIFTRIGEDYCLVALISQRDNLGMAFYEIKKGIGLLKQVLAGDPQG